MRSFTVLLLLLNTLAANSQLLKSEELWKGIRSVKTKSFSGSGGGGYWTHRTIDEEGRTVSTKSYKRTKLLSQIIYKYNEMNDEILSAISFDINNPLRSDSTFTEYEYETNGMIRRQKQTYSNRKDSVVFDLLFINGDTLNYSKRESYHQFKTGLIKTYSYEISLIFNSANQLIYKREIRLEDATTEIKKYEYNNRGLLKRHKIVRIPEPERKVMYVGGPGSDDMGYEYMYYRNGLTKELYYIIGEEKYKIAKYRYKKS